MRLRSTDSHRRRFGDHGRAAGGGKYRHRQLSTHIRSGPAQFISEIVATCGLLLVVLGHRRGRDAPWLVALWIGAAYWFTASTSFANPAITVARALTDTFAGIRPADAPAFVAAQLIGATLATGLARLLFEAQTCRRIPDARPRSRSPKNQMD